MSRVYLIWSSDGCSYVLESVWISRAAANHEVKRLQNTIKGRLFSITSRQVLED